MFRLLHASRQAGRHGCRRIHNVPRLANHDVFSSKGIDGLYSAVGYNQAWSEYQKYLTLNLTLHTTGTENELRSPYQILLQTAKNTLEQHVFHYASQAHNNHFVFEQLADRPSAAATKPSRALMEKLADQNYPDLAAFKKDFVQTAESIVGQGWVFLVELPDKLVRIVKCNNDGTPYYYGKNQLLDLNGGIDEASYDTLEALKQKAAAGERDFALPLLGVSVWETAYSQDYGLTGRSEYLEKFWECINWEVVNKRLFQL